MATSQELLDAVNTAIESLVSGRPVARYSIGGVSLQYLSLQELQDFRSKLQRELTAQNRDPVSYADLSNPVE